MFYVQSGTKHPAKTQATKAFYQHEFLVEIHEERHSQVTSNVTFSTQTSLFQLVAAKLGFKIIVE